MINLKYLTKGSKIKEIKTNKQTRNNLCKIHYMHLEKSCINE